MRRTEAGERPEIVMLGSLPLARPWNGADKVIGRAIVRADRVHRHVVQTGDDDMWPSNVSAVREGDPPAMPGPRAMAGVGRYLARTAGRGEIVHLVASVRGNAPWTGLALRAWRSLDDRPLVHTVPALGTRPVNRALLVGDVTVAFSEHTTMRLREAGAPEVITAFPPVSLDDLDVPDVAAAGFREHLRLGDRPLLYSGHIGTESGMDQAIEAIAGLPARMADVVLVLCLRWRPGQDASAEVRRLQAEARRRHVEGRVRILTNVQDMPSLIAAAAITVLVPRQLDGKMDLPLVLLESLAMGRPVVLGDHAPMREALLGGGLSVPYDDVDALVDAITRLLDDDALRGRLADIGRRRVRTLADPDRIAATYDAIYGRVLECAGIPRLA